MTLLASIIIPVIRPEKAARCIDLAIKRAGIKRDEFEIVTKEDKKRIGCPKMVKALVKRAKAENIVFLGDDCIPQENWLKEAMRYMSLLKGGWGLVGINDLSVRRIATHWVAHKKLLPELDGEFFHTGYYHTYCDNELLHKCNEMGRFIFGEKSIVAHDHPVHTGVSMDADYLRVYSDDYAAHDRALFLKRYGSNFK